jgi:hypothetical protein
LISTRAALIDSPIAPPVARGAGVSDVKITPSLMKNWLRRGSCARRCRNWRATKPSATVSMRAVAPMAPGSMSAQPTRGAGAGSAPLGGARRHAANAFDVDLAARAAAHEPRAGRAPAGRGHGAPRDFVGLGAELAALDRRLQVLAERAVIPRRRRGRMIWAMGMMMRSTSASASEAPLTEIRGTSYGTCMLG